MLHGCVQVNATGVMPVIFSSSLLALPSALARYLNSAELEAAARAVSPAGPLYLPVGHMCPPLTWAHAGSILEGWNGGTDGRADGTMDRRSRVHSVFREAGGLARSVLGFRVLGRWTPTGWFCDSLGGALHPATGGRPPPACCALCACHALG
jgi:hypothetical protein